MSRLDISWHDFLMPIYLSLKVSLFSSIIVFIAGGLAAWIMSEKQFKGKVWIETVMMLPLVLPPTVVGLVLLTFLGRNSWIGQLVESLFQQSIMFTWWAAVFAAVVVSFPLVYRTVKTGFMAVDRDLQDTARSIGASEWQVLYYVTIPMAYRSLIAGFILGFARGMGEFGATLMIAGNIPGRTQTVPTAIYVAADSGNMQLAWLWTASMILVSFLMMLAIHKKL